MILPFKKSRNCMIGHLNLLSEQDLIHTVFTYRKCIQNSQAVINISVIFGETMITEMICDMIFD